MNYFQQWLTSRTVDALKISILKPSGTALHSDGPEKDYIDMRTAYGLKHHWPVDENGVDIDRYDKDPHTRFFLAFDFDKEKDKTTINAGLRLTASMLEDSLSFSMWTHAVDKPHVVAQIIERKDDIKLLKDAASEHKLYDLTRLVTAMSLQATRTKQQKKATYAALLLLLGAAIRYTGEDSYWVFTTNNEVKHFLDKLGIEYYLLAQGRISYSDNGESYFAWTHVKNAYQKLKAGQPIIADLIQRGYELAET